MNSLGMWLLYTSGNDRIKTLVRRLKHVFELISLHVESTKHGELLQWTTATWVVPNVHVTKSNKHSSSIHLVSPSVVKVIVLIHAGQNVPSSRKRYAGAFRTPGCRTLKYSVLFKLLQLSCSHQNRECWKPSSFRSTYGVLPESAYFASSNVVPTSTFLVCAC